VESSATIELSDGLYCISHTFISSVSGMYPLKVMWPNMRSPFTVIVLSPTQPAVLVPVTVYMVVAAGLTPVAAHVLQARPADGDQE